MRLLDVSREFINATVAALWPQLDAFGTRDSTYAYKQVTALIGPSDAHGDRQWRCEAEQAGRILRSQAQRKKQFARILPYAADDGGDKGQAYHLRLDAQKRVVFFAFRFPDAAGRWSRKWAEPEMALTLPDPVAERLQGGAPLAPLLREISEPDGTRYAVLDFIVEVPGNGWL